MTDLIKSQHKPFSKLKIILKTQNNSSQEAITKTCSKCSIIRTISEFYPRYAKCKICTREEDRNRYKINKEKDIARRANPENQSKIKYCYRCKSMKPELSFRINRSECNDCEKQYGRDYNKENKHIRDAWVANNKGRMKQLQAEWYQNNKPHIRAKYNERYHSDPAFKLGQLLRRRLLQGIEKTDATSIYMGVEISFIKQWLEYCFDESMTWDNHGTHWEIDHVIPINQFNLLDDKQVLLCFNWKNLMPLRKTTNMSKHDKIILPQIFLQEIRLRKFFSINIIDDNLHDYLNDYVKHLILISKTP